jgi:SOS-response transcriptional repressor LexA
MAGPTNTQDVVAVYDYVVSYIAEHQRPPTLEQIALATGCGTPSTARRHLIRLRQRGLVSWEWRAQGTLHLCAEDEAEGEEEIPE